jgi:flagellar hook-associated protein 2
MPPINFSGLASGLDTRAMIDAILRLERRPIERLQQRQALLGQRRDALGELRGKLEAFESAVRELSAARTFRGRAITVGDEAVLRATAAPGAETGLYAIEVTGLAAAHKVKSDGFLTADQGLVSDGQITIQSGGGDTITIDVSAAAGN